MKKLLTPFLLLTTIAASAQATHTITIRPGMSGVSASIEKESNLSLPNDDNLIANAWTTGGAPITQRTVFQMPLPVLPSNATFVSATLYLYANTTTTHPQGHSSYPTAPYGTTNEGWLQRITTPWSTSGLNWTGRPSATNTHVVSLPASTSQTQNYTINVSQMVKDMLDSPSRSFGFMLSLQNENTYRSLIFASCHHADSNLRPKLIINYTTPTAVPAANTNVTDVRIYPNPAKGTLYVDFINGSASKVSLQMTDAAGRIVQERMEAIKPSGQIMLDISHLPHGIYHLRIGEGDKPVISRMVTVE